MKLGSIIKDVGKVAAAPFTAGASLTSGSTKLSDWLNGAVSNVTAGLANSPVAGAVGSGLSSSSALGTLLSIGSNLLSNGLSSVTDILKDKYNMANQKELAKYNADQQLRLNQDAFNKNLQMWNMENAYNSPAEQMKRYEEAGLNKNLIYGQSNTAGSAPTFEAPTFSTGQFNPTDTRMQRAQLALAMQEHQAQIKNQQIENMMKLQSLELAERTANRDDRLADAQIKSLENNLGLRYAEFENTLNQPKSWIGRDWYDIKSIGKEAYDRVRKVMPSSSSSNSGSGNWVQRANSYRYNTSFGK